MGAHMKEIYNNKLDLVEGAHSNDRVFLFTYNIHDGSELATFKNQYNMNVLDNMKRLVQQCLTPLYLANANFMKVRSFFKSKKLKV